MAEIQQYLSSHYPDAYVKLNRYNLMFKKYPIEAVSSSKPLSLPSRVPPVWN